MGAKCCKEEPFLVGEENLYTHLVRDQSRNFHDVYDVVKIIGHGSISTISKIKKKRSNGDNTKTKTRPHLYYVLKEIDTSVIEANRIDELENELTLLKALDHPNIIKVYETYKLNNRKAMVLELCTGGDLYTRHPYSEKQAAKIIKECLSAISYLHSHKVIHRDIKYENIMFESKKTDARVKLIDFGLSKCFWHNNQILTGQIGTLYTMSPQVIKGVYTAQADLWSIGVVTFMLLSGSDPPFWGHSLQTIISQVMNSQVEFKGNTWKTRSNESKHFVKSLLKVNPKLRLTAVAALKHPWLSKEIDFSDEEPDAELLSDVKSNLIHYAANDNFKRIALNIIAKNSNTEEICELRKVFDEFDTDHVGSISFQEFKLSLRKLGHFEKHKIKAVFDKLDVNESGVIMYTEFLAAALEAQGRINDVRIKEAFDVLDSNGTGFISAEDLRKVLGIKCSDTYIDEIIKSADIDGDGQISYDDFKQHFEQQYHGKDKGIVQKGQRSRRSNDTHKSPVRSRGNI